MLRILRMLVSMHIRSRMEYRGAFLLDRLAQIASYSAAYAVIWILLNRFETLGGWGWPEMALLLAFHLLTYSLGASFSFVQFRDMENLVRLGTFDTLLVKPISPWAYLTFSGLNIDYVGHIVLAVALMVWALTQVDVVWSFWGAAYLVAVVISASMLVAAIITTLGAASLVLVQSRHLFSIFFGFWELTRYPLQIFPSGLQWLLVTVLPLAFMNYVPVAVFLGEDVPVLGSLAMPMSLAAGPAGVLLAMLFWRFCIRRYQSGGG